MYRELTVLIDQSIFLCRYIKAICFFCEGDAKTESLHEFTTINTDKFVRVIATEMNDVDLLMKLADENLIVIKAKFNYIYHV